METKLLSFKIWRKFTFFTISVFCKLVCKVSAFMQNIQIGSKSKFYGIAYFSNNSGCKITIGTNCTLRSKSTANLIGINRPCIISTQGTSASVVIGNNCGLSGTVISAFDSIKLGNSVRCGANTLITDSDWHPDDYRSGEHKPINIGDNVWLGEGVKILKGVNIGENSLIGINSVVLRDIPSNVVAAGNPCRVVRKLESNHLSNGNIL